MAEVESSRQGLGSAIAGGRAKTWTAGATTIWHPLGGSCRRCAPAPSIASRRRRREASCYETTWVASCYLPGMYGQSSYGNPKIAVTGVLGLRPLGFGVPRCGLVLVARAGLVARPNCPGDGRAAPLLLRPSQFCFTCWLRLQRFTNWRNTAELDCEGPKAMEDRSGCSSPDPLALSYDENSNSPLKPGRRLSAVPLARASSNALVPTTPTRSQKLSEPCSTRSIKSITMRTPGREGGSPWKIRVTVQAEQEDYEGSSDNGTKQSVGTAEIITIPDDDDTTMSTCTTTPRPFKHNVGFTPVKQIDPSKRAPRRDRFGVVDWTAHPGLRERCKRNIGVPTSGDKREANGLAELVSDKTAAGKRPTPHSTSSGSSPLRKKPSLEAERHETASENLHQDNSEPELRTAKGGPDDEEWMAMINHDDDDEIVDDPHDPFEENDRSQLTGTEDDTSVLDRSALESEGFSMISIDSLRSQQNYCRVSLQQQDQKNHTNKITTTDVEATKSIPSPEDMRNPFFRPPRKSLVQLAEMNHLQVLTNGDQHTTHQTPVVDACSSPVPPPVVQTSPIKSSPSKISPAVRAGVALQNAVETSPAVSQNINQNLLNNTENTPVLNSDQVFAGFGDRTRKQLRAGMMMGELLARGERGFANDMAAAKHSSPLDAALSRTHNSNQMAQFSRLPTPSDSDTSFVSDEATKDDSYATAGKLQKSDNDYIVQAHNFKLFTPPDERTNDEIRIEDLEKEWQKDRDDMVWQTEANAKALVVIGSDCAQSDRSTDKEAEDIWQEEANRSMEEAKALKEAEEARKCEARFTGMSEFEDLFEPEPLPARGKLPSPWRRASGFTYSAELDADAYTLPADNTEGGGAQVTEGDYPTEYGSEDFEEYDNTRQLWKQNLPIVFGGRRAKISKEEHHASLSDLLRAPSPLQSSPLKQNRTPQRSVESPVRFDPNQATSEDSLIQHESSDYAEEVTLLATEYSEAHETARSGPSFSSYQRTDLNISDVDQLKKELASMSSPNQKTLRIRNTYDDASFVLRMSSLLPSSSLSSRDIPSPTQSSSEPSLLGRLSSYFWAPSTPAPVWCKAHYTLLNRIWRSSPLAPAVLPPLNGAEPPPLLASAYTRAARAAAAPYPFPTGTVNQGQLPRAMAALVGETLKAGAYALELTAAHVHLVHLFAEEVGGRGLESPDGLCYSAAGDEEKPKQTSWHKEIWTGGGRERDVAVRLFSLVVGEEGRRADAGVVGTVLKSVLV